MMCRVEEPFLPQMYIKDNTASRQRADQRRNWCMDEQSLRKSKSGTNFATYRMLNLQKANQSNLASGFWNSYGHA